ncbi:MAG: hypothetical protein IKM69_02440 [Alistipes sp.]|nr:hypothetical protein [Alistipes sp.]
MIEKLSEDFSSESFFVSARRVFVLFVIMLSLPSCSIPALMFSLIADVSQSGSFARFKSNGTLFAKDISATADNRCEVSSFILSLG